ncbi:hypothetical protein [Ornithinimicrobium kibberense]|uniref:hypothetical protein n=1 Tax=Ornithinimicrobium kibberense TaxID=282060 RepID=UPI0036155B06
MGVREARRDQQPAQVHDPVHPVGPGGGALLVPDPRDRRAVQDEGARHPPGAVVVRARAREDAPAEQDPPAGQGGEVGGGLLEGAHACPVWSGPSLDSNRRRTVSSVRIRDSASSACPGV